VQMRGYPARVYQEDDGSWAAEIPDLPGCVAGAEDPAELFELLADAMNGWIASAEADGVPIPPPSRRSGHSGRFVLRTPPSLHEQLAWRAEQEGVSLNTLCVTALTAFVHEGAASHDPISFSRRQLGSD
jgi:antitoxin HicB